MDDAACSTSSCVGREIDGASAELSPPVSPSAGASGSGVWASAGCSASAGWSAGTVSSGTLSAGTYSGTLSAGTSETAAFGSVVGVNTSVFSGFWGVSATVPSPPSTDAIISLALLTEESSGFMT